MNNLTGIYISTLGRPHRQTTWNNLSHNAKCITTIVVTPKEEGVFRSVLDLASHILVLPPEVKGLSANRQWILDNAKEDIIVFMDDDLTFFYRDIGGVPKEAPQHIVDNILGLFKNSIEEGWGGVKLVGIDPCGPINYGPNAKWLYRNSIIMRCYAVNRLYFKEKNIRFDHTRLLQDFSVNLQVIDSGARSETIMHYGCYDDGPLHAPDGGVSAYRTAYNYIKTVFELHRKHPESIRQLWFPEEGKDNEHTI